MHFVYVCQAATSYEIYIWNNGDERPTEPYAQTSFTSYTPSPLLQENTQILWQIQFLVPGENQSIPSPIWGFTTRPYPDLKVSEIIVPDFAYSGTTFDIQYTIENQGGANTAYPTRYGTVIREWYDAVYIGKYSFHSIGYM